MSKQTLRPYQDKLVHEAREEFRNGCQRVLLCSPVGSGKTTVASHIIESSVAKRGRPVFLAARRELVHQASRRLTVPHGIIMSGCQRTDASVHVASVQSLLTRELPWEPTLIFLDECSHSTAASHQQLLSRFPNVPVVGLTATPVRESGMGLGDYFQEMVCGPSITDLIAQGYLAGIDHYVGPQRNPGLLGDPVAAWEKYARGLPTIAFASSVEESIKLVERFKTAGYRAAHVDGTSEDEYRDSLPGKLASGELEIISNYQVWAEGVDIPAVSCVILDRLTSSIAVYLQAVGRGLRPSTGKAHLTLLDHGGNVWVHGRADQHREWKLTKGRDVLAGPKAKDVADKLNVCPDCMTLAPDGASQCVCGYKFYRKPKKNYKHKAGTLELHYDDGRVSQIDQDRLRSAYERMLFMQNHSKKKDGTPFSKKYAWFRFMQTYGVPPRREWG